jgi:hypothetical protein
MARKARCSSTQPGRCLASFSAERATKRVDAEAEEATT